MHTRSLPALGGAVFALAFDAFYVWVVQREGEGDLQRTDVRWIAGSIAVAAAVLLVSVAIQSPSVRTGLLAASAVILAAWAVVASLSVGILLLPAAALAFMALFDAVHDLPRGRPRLALPVGTGVALVVVAIGLQLGS